MSTNTTSPSGTDRPRRKAKAEAAGEEIVAELTSVFLGQTLGFTAHTLEMNAAYLHNWLRVLRSDKGAIFRHAADAQRACDYLIARSETGRAGSSAEAA